MSLFFPPIHPFSRHLSLFIIAALTLQNAAVGRLDAYVCHPSIGVFGQQAIPGAHVAGWTRHVLLSGLPFMVVLMGSSAFATDPTQEPLLEPVRSNAWIYAAGLMALPRIYERPLRRQSFVLTRAA